MQRLPLVATCAALAVAAGCGGPSTTPVPALSHAARLALTVDGEDALALVSPGDAPALLARYGVGDDPARIEGPHHLAASPDGSTLYVPLSNLALGAPGQLLRIDAARYTTTGRLRLERDPGDLVLTRDGATLFVSHYDLRRLTDQLAAGAPPEAAYAPVVAIATATMTAGAPLPVCVTAHGLALSADERSLFVACALADQLAIVDLGVDGGLGAVRRVSVGPLAGAVGSPTYFPYAVARSPADGRVWISCQGGSGGWSGLRVYDPARGAMDDAHAVPLPGSPMFGDWLPDGVTLVVPQQGRERVSLVDTTRGAEAGGIDLPAGVCQRAHMLRVAPGGARAWLVCEGDHVTVPGTLVSLDLVARAVLGSLPIGLYPDGVALLPPAP